LARSLASGEAAADSEKQETQGYHGNGSKTRCPQTSQRFEILDEVSLLLIGQSELKNLFVVADD